MTASAFIEQVGGFGPLLAQYGLTAEQVEQSITINTDDLSPEELNAVLEYKILDAIQKAAGLRRAHLLRFLRDSRFPITGKDSEGHGLENTRKGWSEFLRREFDLNVKDANLEIKGLECWEAAQKAVLPAPAVDPASPSADTRGGAPLHGVGTSGGARPMTQGERDEIRWHTFREKQASVLAHGGEVPALAAAGSDGAGFQLWLGLVGPAPTRARVFCEPAPKREV